MKTTNNFVCINFPVELRIDKNQFNIWKEVFKDQLETKLNTKTSFEDVFGYSIVNEIYGRFDKVSTIKDLLKYAIMWQFEEFIYTEIEKHFQEIGLDTNPYGDNPSTINVLLNDAVNLNIMEIFKSVNLDEDMFEYFENLLELIMEHNHHGWFLSGLLEIDISILRSIN